MCKFWQLLRAKNSCFAFLKDTTNGGRTMPGVAVVVLWCFGAGGAPSFENTTVEQHHCGGPTLLNSRVQHQHQQRRVERLGGDLASSFSSRLICWRRQPSISDISYIWYLGVLRFIDMSCRRFWLLTILDKRWHLSSNRFELIKAVRILSFPAAAHPMVQAAAKARFTLSQLKTALTQATRLAAC